MTEMFIAHKKPILHSQTNNNDLILNLIACRKLETRDYQRALLPGSFFSDPKIISVPYGEAPEMNK